MQIEETGPQARTRISDKEDEFFSGRWEVEDVLQEFGMTSWIKAWKIFS